MKIVGILGASCIACTTLLSFQGGGVANVVEGEKAVGSTESAAFGRTWDLDLKAGRYRAAVGKLNDMLNADRIGDERRAHALVNRGLAHQQLERYKRAVADYTEALKIDAMAPKTRAVAIYNRGLAYQKLKRQALAIEDLTNALYLDVEFAHAYYGRGRLMQEVGRYEFALADFEKAMKYRYPAQHLPFYGQALAYQATQQKTKARKALSRALLFRPDFKPALDKYAELTGSSYDVRHTVIPASHAPSGDAARNGHGRAQLPEPSKTGPFKPVTASARTIGDRTSVGPVAGNSVVAESAPHPARNVVSLKRPFRHPDMSGATPPVPTMTPPTNRVDLPTGAPKEAAEPRNSTSRSVDENEKIDGRNLMPEAGREADIVTGSVSPAKPAGDDRAVAAASDASDGDRATDVGPVGWFIQVNAQRTKEAAEEIWRTYRAKHKKALQDANVVYQRADLGGRGVYWRVRLGAYEAWRAADRKCRRLKRSGLSCFVVKAG